MDKKTKNSRRNIMIMFFLLLFFWSIIDGKLTVESVFLGSLASVLIIYINKDIISTISDEGSVTIQFIWNFMALIAVLIVEIVKSNINVAKIVLNPKMPIEPSFVRVPVRFKKDFNKVLYGNVVTLTPGTLTVDIVGDEYIIHALTKEAAEGLYESDLEKHVLRLEEKKS